MMADLNEDLNSFASEHSFVILGQGSLTSDVNDTLPSVNSNQFGSHHNSESNILQETDPRHDSMPQSLSPTGIQSKLDRLIKENLLLKETLNHSNEAMKNQFDTLTLWHEEVVRTHESHKQKFEETQDQILKLRNENMSLKKLIQQNMDKCNPNNQASICDGKEDMLTSMKMESVSGEQVNSDFICTEELRLKNTELERNLHDITVEKSDLESQLKRLIEENVQLKSCDKPNYDKCIQCQGVTNLMTTKKSDEKEGKIVSEESLSQNTSVLERILVSGKSNLEGSQMKEDFAFMKQRLDEGLKLLENGERMNELRIQNEEMCKIKNELENELKSCKAEVEKLKEENNRFSQELKGKDDLLESKQKELDEARSSIKELESECEKIPVLEVQLELYKKDFNEERAAREKAVAEKEKFVELVRSSVRLKQNEEKKKLEQSSSSTENKEVKSYPCPKCWIRFSKPEDCEEHVFDCLNLDFL